MATNSKQNQKVWTNFWQNPDPSHQKNLIQLWNARKVWTKEISIFFIYLHTSLLYSCILHTPPTMQIYCRNIKIFVIQKKRRRDILDPISECFLLKTGSESSKKTDTVPIDFLDLFQKYYNSMQIRPKNPDLPICTKSMNEKLDFFPPPYRLTL